MWTDSHCHVPWTSQGGELVLDDAALDEARAAGVGRFVTVGTDALTSERAIATAARHADVWATDPLTAVQRTAAGFAAAVSPHLRVRVAN